MCFQFCVRLRAPSAGIASRWLGGRSCQRTPDRGRAVWHDMDFEVGVAVVFASSGSSWRAGELSRVF
jgi:hypothetical protein